MAASKYFTTAASRLAGDGRSDAGPISRTLESSFGAWMSSDSHQDLTLDSLKRVVGLLSKAFHKPVDRRPDAPSIGILAQTWNPEGEERRYVIGYHLERSLLRRYSRRAVEI